MEGVVIKYYIRIIRIHVFMKKYLKIFVIAIIIFIAFGVGIPLSLRSSDGVDAVTQDKKEQVFLEKATKEADTDFDKLESFIVLRLKVVNILRDVPNCEGSVYRYVGFIRAYSFFNVPYIRQVIVYSKDGEKISGSIIETTKKFKTIQDKSGMELCF